MNHNRFQCIFSVLMLLALVTALVPLAARAEGGSLYITGYTVKNAAGGTVGSITKGNTVNITVSVKDTGDGTGSSDPAGLDITKLDDSFTGGTVSVSKTSSPGQPLIYAIQLTGLQYKGVGQILRLQIGKAGDSASYQTMEITITEAVVYEAPTPAPPVDITPEAAPAPMVLISRSDIASPLQPGQEKEIELSFQNLGTTRLKSAVVTLTPSDGLLLSSGSSSFVLDEIPGKKSVTLKVKIKAAAVIPSASQSLGVELKFNYYNNIATVQGSVTDKVTIPAQARESVPQPVVIVTRSPMDNPIAPDETREMTVTFQNAGAAKLVSPSASVTPSDSLILLNDTSTFLLPDLEPGKSASISLKIKAAAEISSTTQSIATELKYSYDNGETMAQATASDKVSLSANATLKSDTSVPSIVIRDFSYGGASVAAGSKFPLSFTFENTGKVGIENVVVTVDGGESFTMDGSTNTFYYSSLPAGGRQIQDVPMRTVPTSKSGAQNISVGFKYEYVDGEKRSQASADIKISLPVYQPDRFHINAPTVPESVNVGEETEILLSYVNKGKDDLANLEATVEGEGVSTPARTQYLGNVTAGTSGNVGFALTPEQEGDIKLVLKISYENGDQQVQTREFPITLSAVDVPPADDYSPDDLPPEDVGFPVVPVATGAGAVVLVLAAVLIIRKKKAADAAQEDWSDWNDEHSGSSGGEG